MRIIALRKHFLVFLLILIISYSLFTLVPTLFPHPEDFSPYVYVVAFLACLEVWLTVKDKSRKWLLLPVLLICLLAFLDETGYGSEVLDIPPIYSDSLHTQVRDLHNLIGIAMELGSQALEDAGWNAPLFTAFLAVDGVLVAGGLFFGWVIKFWAHLKEKMIERRILRLTAALWFVSGSSASVYLLTLSQDPKNAFLLGYSATRLALVLAAPIISTFPLLLLFSNNSMTWLKHMLDRIDRNSRTIWVVCLILVLIAVAYQLYAPFVTLPDQQTRLERITPLVLWVMAIAWFALLGAQAWRGGLREPISMRIDRFADFLRREPAYFYMISAVGLIFVAQLIDQGFIPLNTMIRTPGFHITQWGLWTEEMFEMTGAFLFIAAAFHFPKTK